MGGIVGFFFFFIHFIPLNRYLHTFICTCMYMSMYEYSYFDCTVFHVHIEKEKKFTRKKKYIRKIKTSLLPSARPPPEIKILSDLVKISWATEIEFFPLCAVSHENYSLSQIFGEWLWFLHRMSIVSIWVKKFCNIHSFLFQPYEYQNAANTPKRYLSFERQLDCNFLIKKSKYTLWWNETTGNKWLKNWNFANYCKNEFLQFNFHVENRSQGFLWHTHWANYKKVNRYKQLFKGSFCDFTKYDFL